METPRGKLEIPRGKSTYKKNTGVLTLTDDLLSLIWTPLPATGPPVISLSVANIMNLQQTPDTAPKVILKVVEKPRTAEGEPVSYMFQFPTTSEGKAEANAVKELLSTVIKTLKTDPSMLKAAVNGEAGGAAAANGANKPPAIKWFDDDMLTSDTELQQSLMKKDAVLRQTYDDARETRPTSIPEATFNAHFWSTRIGLLRAHAIEQNQKKGAYNVLAQVKPKTVDGELKLDLNVDAIRMIFQQFPLVKRLYNEHVPKIDEGQFWSRFFLSRLSKRLRGERVSENDNTDPLFDKHTEADNVAGFTSRITAQQVPRVIDLEGNEENQGGFKSGNRKDVEMRPRRNIPIVRTLNSLSESIMANVAPTDQDPAGPAPVDDDTIRELSLRDLRGDAEINRIMLNVKEQTKLFSTGRTDAEQSADALLYARQVPSDVLFEVQADLETLEDDGAGGINLHRSIGVDDESDSDREEMGAAAAAATTTTTTKPGGKTAHVGSRAARREAQDQILTGMRKKRAETYGHDGDEASPMGIPADLAQRCYATGATTTEFLKQFWHVFLSGDAARAPELAYHAEALSRCRARVDALAEEAERTRAQANARLKAEIKEHFRKTGKKMRWQPVGGGKDAVLALFEATLGSLDKARALYDAAYRAQNR